MGPKMTPFLTPFKIDTSKKYAQKAPSNAEKVSKKCPKNDIKKGPKNGPKNVDTKGQKWPFWVIFFASKTSIFDILPLLSSHDPENELLKKGSQKKTQKWPFLTPF